VLVLAQHALWQQGRGDRRGHAPFPQFPALAGILQAEKRSAQRFEQK
jgi:hypothetical protein